MRAPRPRRLGWRQSAVDAVVRCFRCAPVHLVVFLLLSIVTAVLPVVAALALSHALDALISSTRGGVVGPVLVLAAVGLADAGLRPLATYLETEVYRRTDLTARDDLFRALESHQGLASLESPDFHNRLSVAEDAGARSQFDIVRGLLSVAQSLITTASFFGAVAVRNVWLAVVVVAAAVPVLLSQVALSRRQADMALRSSATLRRELFYRTLLSAPDAAMELRLFGALTFIRHRMLDQAARANALYRRVDRERLAHRSGAGVLGALVSTGALLWSARSTESEQLTVGGLAIVVAALSAVQGSLAAGVAAIGDLYTAARLHGMYLDVLEAVPDINPGGRVAVQPLRDAVELRDVWFRYDEAGPWVLRGVTLRIEAGTSLGLVGLNGAGKSTLVKLLTRMYEPTQGSILWDGVDLRDLDVVALRARMGAIFQDFFCYDLTARENIGISDVSGLDDLDRVTRAAADAGVAETLQSLPSGYETMLSRTYFETEPGDAAHVGDSTAYLSGGQWQKVALARGLFRENADLLLLDEPSAGLDAHAEALMHTRITQLRAGRTSVLVSHRLSAIRAADHIVVLHDGQVAESGTHDDLVAAGSLYADMYLTQAVGYDDVGATP